MGDACSERLPAWFTTWRQVRRRRSRSTQQSCRLQTICEPMSARSCRGIRLTWSHFWSSHLTAMFRE
eukprot:jgi/Astpho2/9868/gw1.00151.20.1_t